ncbi:hypothetical protein [Streptomyces sp. NPDC001292]|uniref:hypothetical protein n=1 Tax=Streptomyces sp. NPDC001292 TaxID=3364558 RepID=UPI0036CF415F
MARTVGHCNIDKVGTALTNPLGVLRAWTELGAEPSSVLPMKVDAGWCGVPVPCGMCLPPGGPLRGGDPNVATSFR